MVSRKLATGLCGFGLLALAGAEGARPADPIAWLERMGEAVEHRNYTGTFLHLAGSESRAMRVVHRAASGSRPAAERLLALDGQPREVLREDRVTRCIMPARRTVVVDELGQSPLSSALPEISGELQNLYRITDLGAERIAGRRTMRVAVLPEDQFRFGYHFWLDQDTALPLKTMTVGRNGRVVELIHFTEIAFPASIADRDLAQTLASDGFTTVRPPPTADEEVAAQTDWRPQHLPAGFRLSLATRQRTESGTLTEHLVYSDGLASVSVFIERVGGLLPRRANFAELGAASAFSRTLGAYQIVVIGEVPADTVTMIGRSMHHTGTAGGAAP